MQYSSCDFMDKIFHSAISFVRLYVPGIPWCNIFRIKNEIFRSCDIIDEIFRSCQTIDEIFRSYHTIDKIFFLCYNTIKIFYVCNIVYTMPWTKYFVAKYISWHNIVRTISWSKIVCEFVYYFWYRANIHCRIIFSKILFSKWLMI